jgi:hypothetical protein
MDGADARMDAVSCEVLNVLIKENTEKKQTKKM